MLPQRPAARVFLGVGSNQGDRLSHLRGTEAELLERQVTVVRRSSVYESPYLGDGEPQPAYLNAVLEARTKLDPWQLLKVLQAIERCHGRRPASHMRPRPLDLDILFFAGQVCSAKSLTLPHPRLSERRFVLEPLAELGALDSLPTQGLQRRLQELQLQQKLALFAPWHCSGERREVRF